MNKNNKITPLISIIVPIYNVERYLRKCVDSILDQTYKNLQIILVDDGSPDDCGKICDEYARIDSRIQVIHKKNGGLSDARNAGLDVASGDYIGFVDSDDWIDPGMYESLINAIKKDKSDISICGVVREYSNYSKNQKSKNLTLCRDEALTMLLSNNGIKDYAWNKLYDAKLWSGLRFPKGAYYEDIYTTYKTFLKSSKVTLIQDSLYHYYQRDGSIARGTINPRQMEMITAIHSIMENESVPSKFNEILLIRELKIKYLLLWNMLVLGERDTMREYEDIGKSLYYDIKNNKSKIVCSKYVNISMKCIALLSILPFPFIKWMFSFRNQNR